MLASIFDEKIGSLPHFSASGAVPLVRLPFFDPRYYFEYIVVVVLRLIEHGIVSAMLLNKGFQVVVFNYSPTTYADGW